MSWSCPLCVQDEADEEEGGKQNGNKNVVKKRIAAVRKIHRELKSSSAAYLDGPLREHLEPFVNAIPSTSNDIGGYNNHTPTPITIGPQPSFVNATLRPYQVTGVNFLLGRYALGTGCIVADEMGLGKTIQSLSFLASLKDAGVPGPHLVVTVRIY